MAFASALCDERAGAEPGREQIHVTYLHNSRIIGKTVKADSLVRQGSEE